MYANSSRAYNEYISNTVLFKIKRYLSKTTPVDLIYHHCLSDNSYVAATIARHLNVPYVFTEYSNYYSYEGLNKFNPYETRDDHYSFVRGAAERIAATTIRARGYEHIFD